MYKILFRSLHKITHIFIPNTRIAYLTWASKFVRGFLINVTIHPILWATTKHKFVYKLLLPIQQT